MQWMSLSMWPQLSVSEHRFVAMKLLIFAAHQYCHIGKAFSCAAPVCSGIFSEEVCTYGHAQCMEDMCFPTAALRAKMQKYICSHKCSVFSLMAFKVRIAMSRCSL